MTRFLVLPAHASIPSPTCATVISLRRLRESYSHHIARGDGATIVIFNGTIWMSVLTGSVFASLRFHCIMHSPQYLPSANASARGSGGRRRPRGAALGPAEGLLRSESFRNLNLPSSASRWRHSWKGRSVRFRRKSPFPPPSFLQMSMFILE